VGEPLKRGVMLLLLMNVTRILLIGSITLLLAGVVNGQDSEIKLGRTIKREELLALPRRDAVPALTLQRAMKIAERFTKKKKLDISSAYLFEAKWSSSPNNPATGAWYFWWVSTKHSKPDIRIAVSLDGRPRLLPVLGAT
jgi:hypothetical protein